MKAASLPEYDYQLPPELIAHAPASPRDSARLFVYDTAADKITFDVFANIDKHLPEGAGLVINNTKVVPARLIGHKEKDIHGNEKCKSVLRKRGRSLIRRTQFSASNSLCQTVMSGIECLT